MMGVLILTHGRLGSETLRCAENIVGKQRHVRVLGMQKSDGPADFQAKVLKCLKALNGPEGVIVMTDIMGGTPCNTALKHCEDPDLNYEVLTGINLPMLISVLSRRGDMSMEQLAQKVVEDGPRTFQRPVEKLRKLQKKKEESSGR